MRRKSTTAIAAFLILTVAFTSFGFMQQIAPLPNSQYMLGVDTNAIARRLIGINSSNNVSLDPGGLGTAFGGAVTITGTITPTGNILVPNGTTASPSLSWASEPTTGWIRAGAGDIRTVFSGVQSLAWGANSVLPTSSDSFALGASSNRYSSLFLSGAAGGDATTGSVGELVTASVTSGALVNLATGSATTITSITLTAGDWDVTGIVAYRLNVATSVTVLQQASTSLGTGTLGNDEFAKSTFETAANVMTATVDPAFIIPTKRYSISASTLVFLASNAVFSVNIAQAYGQIRARRVR